LESRENTERTINAEIAEIAEKTEILLRTRNETIFA